MRCVCGHMSWVHGRDEWRRTEPCKVCIRCGDTCCRCLEGRKPCLCNNFQAREAS
jgi:hypothetical protein